MDELADAFEEFEDEGGAVGAPRTAKVRGDPESPEALVEAANASPFFSDAFSAAFEDAPGRIAESKKIRNGKNYRRGRRDYGAGAGAAGWEGGTAERLGAGCRFEVRSDNAHSGVNAGDCGDGHRQVERTGNCRSGVYRFDGASLARSEANEPVAVEATLGGARTD